MPTTPRITPVFWNRHMSSKRLNELLATSNIHEDDEDAILGELRLRDATYVSAMEIGFTVAEAQMVSSIGGR